MQCAGGRGHALGEDAKTRRCVQVGQEAMMVGKFLNAATRAACVASAPAACWLQLVPVLVSRGHVPLSFPRAL